MCPSDGKNVELERLPQQVEKSGKELAGKMERSKKIQTIPEKNTGGKDKEDTERATEGKEKWRSCFGLGIFLCGSKKILAKSQT